MATTKKQTAASKELTLVAIYKFKSNKELNGTRCYLVRNSEGKEYKVWTHTFGCASSCQCDGFTKSHGRRKCYHVKFAEAREAARKASPAGVGTTATTPVAIETIAPQEVEKKAAIAAQMKQEKADVAQLRQAELDAGLRPVSMDWLLGHRNGGTFSGKVA
jgi:sarcosine oxidase delta subunit